MAGALVRVAFGGVVSAPVALTSNELLCSATPSPAVSRTEPALTRMVYVPLSAASHDPSGGVTR